MAGVTNERALDAMMAEKVMGIRFWLEKRGEYELAVWTKGGVPWHQNSDKPRYREVDADLAFTTGFFGHMPPKYSQDISAAFEVVKRLRDHPDLRFRTLHMVVYPYDRTFATFDHAKYESGENWSEGNGDHATENAICLAALEAFGVDV